MKPLAITLVVLPALLLSIALACKPFSETALPNALSIGACLSQQPVLRSIRIEDARKIATGIFLDLEAVAEKIKGGETPSAHEIESLYQASEIAHAVGSCLPNYGE